jgi:hypothetical protein
MPEVITIIIIMQDHVADFLDLLTCSAFDKTIHTCSGHMPAAPAEQLLTLTALAAPPQTTKSHDL